MNSIRDALVFALLTRLILTQQTTKQRLHNKKGYTYTMGYLLYIYNYNVTFVS